MGEFFLATFYLFFVFPEWAMCPDDYVTPQTSMGLFSSGFVVLLPRPSLSRQVFCICQVELQLTQFLPSLHGFAGLPCFESKFSRECSRWHCTLFRALWFANSSESATLSPHVKGDIGKRSVSNASITRLRTRRRVCCHWATAQGISRVEMSENFFAITA